MSYVFLEHTADVKFRAEGPSIEEVLRESAKALLFTMRGDINILEQKEEVFEVSGKDREVLLHNFLEEFLFFLDAKNFLVSSIKELSIDLESLKIRCVVLGDDADNYKFTNDVKAVTYNEMYLREQDGKWSCQVVLDV